MGGRRSGPVSRNPWTKTRRLAAQTQQFFLRGFFDEIKERRAECFAADTHQHGGTSHQALNAVDLEGNTHGMSLYQHSFCATYLNEKRVTPCVLLQCRACGRETPSPPMPHLEKLSGF